MTLNLERKRGGGRARIGSSVVNCDAQKVDEVMEKTSQFSCAVKCAVRGAGFGRVFIEWNGHIKYGMQDINVRSSALLFVTREFT